MDSSRAKGEHQVVHPNSKRSPELANKICSLLAEGFSLRYCSSELNFSQPFFYAWIKDDPEVLKQYIRAREIQADVLADDIVAIADDGQNDTYTDENGNVRVDNDVIQRSRLRVEARKWVAAKLLPKKYGDVPNQTNFNQTIVIPVLSQEKQQELQERKRKLLEE